MAYKLTHPDSNQEIEREKDQVPIYTSQGWQTRAGVKEPTTTADSATSKE